MVKVATTLCLAFMLGFCNGEIDWTIFPKESFSWEHNMNILKASARDNDHLQSLFLKPVTREIPLNDTIFTLFTNKGPAEGVRINAGDNSSLVQGKFDPENPVVIATHGFVDNGTADWMMQVKDAHLKRENCNVIIINWMSCADNIIYPIAVDCTITVGGYMSDLIGFLISQGSDVKKMHLMGHSLGAHLVAQASQHGYIVKRITGWDPAGPLYTESDTAARIDPTDADVVDIIHTDMRLFGYHGVLGHYDFYPNGGNNQPVCGLLNDPCNHRMSFYYWIQSLYHNQKYPATQCDNFTDAELGSCSGPTAYMGIDSVESAHGLYHITVEEAATGEP